MAASAGRILLMPKGDYIDSTEYNILDIVRDGGKTWVCKQTCMGQAPAENTYWFLLCQDGASGTVGSIWYTGTGITGTSETPTIFSGSGVALANATDMYLNSSTGNVYQCAAGGNAATAEWVFVIALGGTASWASIADKPFNTIGSNGLIINTDVLDVDLLKIERKASTLTSKAAVVLADEMVIVDSADSSITKRSPFSALKTLFDTLYNNYSLPTASTTTLGGVKVGTGLEMDGETLNTTGSGGGTVINDPTTTPETPLETTNVLDDITSVMNNTSANQLAGALALKELNSNLQLIIDYIFALGGMPLIPAMTGYTTPSGEVTYSSEYTSDGKFAWLAFDRDYSSFWSGRQSVSGASLVYEFANPVTISRFVFLPTNTDTGVAHTARIYVSDDGTTWAQVVSEGLTATQAKQEQIVNITPVSAKFIKYQPSGYTRKTANFSYTSCAELQAYGFIAMNL